MGDLIQFTRLGDDVGAAVSHVGNVGARAKYQRAGQSRSSAGHAICDHVVGCSNCVHKHFLQRRLAGVSFLADQDGQIELARNIMDHCSSGQRTGNLASLMTAHAVGQGKDTERW